MNAFWHSPPTEELYPFIFSSPSSSSVISVIQTNIRGRESEVTHTEDNVRGRDQEVAPTEEKNGTAERAYYLKRGRESEFPPTDEGLLQ